MRVEFSVRDTVPERCVAEAAIVFEGEAFGALEGMKLVGFTLWRSPEGEVYVTFPSRAFGAGNDRRFFDYVRSATGEASHGKRLKAWITDAWKVYADQPAE